CFEITNVTWPEPGYIDVDIKITHPYADPYYTIFDVRGIIMFDGSLAFPESGMTMSEKCFGDGELLNAEGYTSLYNTWTIGSPATPIQEYYQGSLATLALPDSILNGYIRHISDDPSNTRNALLTGDSVTRTYSIKYPAFEYVLGYAVDASWAEPQETPVDDPMTDFGPNANSPEPWKIEVLEFGDGLTDQGGTTWLQIDVYDWQGKESYDPPVIECPELFDGIKNAGFIKETGEYARYHVSLSNDKLAPGRFYKCLVSVQDHGYNPNFPWIDMVAHQTVDVRVEGAPIAVAGANPATVDLNVPIYFWSYFSYDPDGGEITKYEWDWDNDGVYDETGPEAVHAFDVAAYHLVQCRVTDDEGKTDVLDEPLTVTVLGPGVPGNPIDVSPEWINNVLGVWLDGNTAYVTLHPDYLYILDVSNPYSPVVQGKVELPGITKYVTAAEGIAYVIYSTRLLIVDVDPPGQAHIINETNIESSGIRCIDIHDGYLYVGCHMYMQIYDVTPPELIYLVKTFPMKEDGYYTYWDPFGPPIYYTFYGTASSIGFSGQKVYIADTLNALYCLNIENPEYATVVFKKYSFQGEELCVFNNYLYEISTSFDNPYLINIWDMNILPDGEIVGTLDPDITLNGIWCGPAGYIGTWSGDEGWNIYDVDPPSDIHIIQDFDSYGGRTSVSNGIACMAGKNGLEVWDIDPPETAHLTYESGTIGNPEVLEANEGYVYLDIQSDVPGIKIVDTDPLEHSHVVKDLWFPDTGWIVDDIAYSDGYIFVTLNDEFWYRLYIVDVTVPEDAFIASSIDLQASPESVFEDGYAYVACEVGGDDYLYIYDYDPVNLVQEVKSIIIPVPTESEVLLTYHDGYVYLAGESYEDDPEAQFFAIVDVDPLGSTHIVNLIDDLGFYQLAGIEISNGHAFVTCDVKSQYYDDLKVLDVDPPEVLDLVNTVTLCSGSGELEIESGFCYVPTWTTYYWPILSWVNIYSINPPGFPTLFNKIELADPAVDITVDENRLYVITEFGLQIFELW
ncbi:hypothetical protein KAU08_10340, partial [bacterium]|nr:hypothetical protein [bacterium]